MAPSIFSVALILNCVEVLAGSEFVLTGLGWIGTSNSILLADFGWVHECIRTQGEPAQAIVSLYGCALLSMGCSGLSALIYREPATRHGCLMYGCMHSAVAAFCIRFRSLSGLFPGGFIFHGIAGLLFLAALPSGGREKRS